jgi:hypothetical protein
VNPPHGPEELVSVAVPESATPPRPNDVSNEPGAANAVGNPMQAETASAQVAAAKKVESALTWYREVPITTSRYNFAPSW